MRQAKMMGHAKCLALLIVTSFATVTPGFAVEPGYASVQKLVNIFAAPTASNFRGAANYIDYEAMSQRSLGSEWTKLTPKQKSDYTMALRGLMEQRYYPRWHRIFAKSKVEYVSKTASGGDLLVKTKLVVGQKKDAMTWRLNDRSDKVVSLAIGNKDLLDRLTSRLQPRLKKSGFTSMLAWMQSHAKGSDEATQTSSAETILGEAH